MSDKEFDWNDDLSFESLADEADLSSGYTEDDESLADLGDLADFADSPEEDPEVQADAEFASAAETGPSNPIQPFPAPYLICRPKHTPREKKSRSS